MENVCDSWCMHQNETGLFSSAAVSHKVNLLSCVARRPLCHKINLPRCEAQRCHFIMTCDIFGTGQTNILLYIIHSEKHINQLTTAPLSSHWNQHTRPSYGKSCLRWHRHSTEGFQWFPWNVCEKKRGSEPQGAVSRNSEKLGNYKMLVNLRET